MLDQKSQKRTKKGLKKENCSKKKNVTQKSPQKREFTQKKIVILLKICSKRKFTKKKCSKNKVYSKKLNKKQLKKENYLKKYSKFFLYKFFVRTKLYTAPPSILTLVTWVQRTQAWSSAIPARRLAFGQTKFYKYSVQPCLPLAATISPEGRPRVFFY